MKTNRSSKIIVTGLFASALVFTQLTARAVIVGPYTADANTLHLWHMDTGVPVLDAVATGGTNLVKLGAGATLATNSYPGFGTALNTMDGGQNGTAQTAKDAYLTASSATTPTNVAITLADPTTSAFTVEALVWIGFDPTKNLGATANGGNNHASSCEIMTGESMAIANRIFQFRIDPIGTIGTGGGNTTVNLDFVNVNLGASQSMSIAIPTTGPDAILSNNWYHVAVTYNGNPGAAGNITFYWTLLDSSRTNASATGTSQMTANLPAAATTFTLGNIAGRSTNANFLGLIDEVRISNIARAADGMMFAPSPPIITSQPASQTVGIGQSAGFSVTASGVPLFYQWQHAGTNLSGATQSAYSIAAAQFTDAGSYDVVITNNYGALTSSVALLTVRTPLNLKRTQCKSNLRQVGIACIAYANDNKDVVLAASGGVQPNALEPLSEGSAWASVGLTLTRTRPATTSGVAPTGAGFLIGIPRFGVLVTSTTAASQTGTTTSGHISRPARSRRVSPSPRGCWRRIWSSASTTPPGPGAPEYRKTYLPPGFAACRRIRGAMPCRRAAMKFSSTGLRGGSDRLRCTLFTVGALAVVNSTSIRTIWVNWTY